jgi:hypothetical protein
VKKLFEESCEKNKKYLNKSGFESFVQKLSHLEKVNSKYLKKCKFFLNLFTQTHIPKLKKYFELFFFEICN